MNNIELARETVRKFIGAHEATMDSYQQKGFDEGVALVAALLARVRLEEAKWWGIRHAAGHGLGLHELGKCDACDRIAALEAAAKEGGK